MPKTDYFITTEVYLAEPYPAFLLVLCRCVRPTWLVIHAKQVQVKRYPLVHGLLEDVLSESTVGTGETRWLSR